MNKIIILANDSEGTFLFRRELMKKLSETNQVVVCAPDTGYVKEINQMGCQYIPIVMERRGVNPIKDLKLLGQYYKLLNEQKPNQVITYTIKPNIYGGIICRLLQIPYAENITGLGTAFQKKGLLCIAVTCMYKISIKRAKEVFFENSENCRVFLDKKIVKKQQTCLLNGAGVNLDYYSFTEYPDLNEKTSIRFLFIGRVMKEKGIEELLKAMLKLRNDGVNCVLDVLGIYEENYENILEKYQKEGWLFYYGHQKDVRPFIKRVHCFVLPSWHEGMANTNLESAAMGRPVITSDIPGCREAVVEHKSGLLCEAGNCDSLYRTMKQFVELPYEEKINMGAEGRKHMELVFDKKRVVEKTIENLSSCR